MCDRLIQLSFAKIVNSKNERGGAKLRKNLLILRLLQQAKNELKYRQSQANSQEAPLSLVVSDASASNVVVSDDNKNATNDSGDSETTFGVTVANSQEFVENQDENSLISTNDDNAGCQREQQANIRFNAFPNNNNKRPIDVQEAEQIACKKPRLSQVAIYVGNNFHYTTAPIVQFVCSS